MKSLLVSTFVCGSVTLFSSQAMGANLTIDNFNAVTGAPSTSETCEAFLGVSFDYTCLIVGGSSVLPPVNATATSSESGLPTSSVLGGTREIALNYQGPGADISNLEVFNDQLTLMNNEGVLSAATVTWNRGGSGLGNFRAYEQFQVTVAPDNADTFTLTLTVNDTLSVGKTIPSNPSTPISFMFCEFLGNCADPNPDLSFFNSVSSLALSLSGGNGYDANIDLIEAIPRPAAGVPEPSVGLDAFIILVLGGGIMKWRKS